MDFTVFALEKKGIFMCIFTMQTYSFLKLCRYKEPRRFGIKRGNFQSVPKMENNFKEQKISDPLCTFDNYIIFLLIKS